MTTRGQKWGTQDLVGCPREGKRGQWRFPLPEGLTPILHAVPSSSPKGNQGARRGKGTERLRAPVWDPLLEAAFVTK